jgi:CHRD domain/Copper binding proteins, plastocyanin/azurin family
MIRGSTLIATTVGAMLVLAGGGQSRNQETPPVLTGTVGPGFTISLLGPDGQPVTTLVEGTYSINVSDRAAVHDFHLFGPGVNQSTGVGDVMDTTWTVTLQPGGYAFVCDPHVGAAMRGTFSVVRATQLAAPLTKKQIVGTTVGTRGSGSFFATLTRNSSGSAALNWNLAFANLTGPATAADVHLGMPGRVGAVVVPLCTSCQTGSKGSADVPGSALQALLSGRAYVDVHTKRNPGGEIRGQLAVQGS